MYTASRAARIRIGSFFSDAWKACAVPWKPGWIDDGDETRGERRVVPAYFVDREVTHREADEPRRRSAEHGEPQSRAAAARERGMLRGLAGRHTT